MHRKREETPNDPDLNEPPTKRQKIDNTRDNDVKIKE